METNLPICFIGDLHCRLETLKRILSAYPNHFYVFVGDIVHSKKFFKQRTSTSFEILAEVRRLCDQGQAAAIIGNNEYTILNNLISPEKNIRKKELRQSLKELKSMQFSHKMSWLRWLQDLPYKVSINEYVVSHAYPSDIMEEALYGPNHIWFKPHEKIDECPIIQPDKKYIIGHYGYPFITERVKCIDATNFGGVGIYISSPEQFLIFH